MNQLLCSLSSGTTKVFEDVNITHLEACLLHLNAFIVVGKSLQYKYNITPTKHNIHYFQTQNLQTVVSHRDRKVYWSSNCVPDVWERPIIVVHCIIHPLPSYAYLERRLRTCLSVFGHTCFSYTCWISLTEAEMILYWVKVGPIQSCRVWQA